MTQAFTFPEGFLWGSAASAHQVEGNNIHNDWWAWEQSGRVKEPSGIACDHYKRYPSDFELAASLGHKVHRFSVEWSRVQPEEGYWDEDAIGHYVDVVKALRQRGLEPMPTLHHFTTPLWLAKQGSWTNPKVSDLFGAYAARMAKALSPYTRFWITINEPMIYVNMHYWQGIGPPGGRDFKESMRVVRHAIRAHALAYHAIHQEAKAGMPKPMVSIAQAVPRFEPCRRWWPLDHITASLSHRLASTEFLKAVIEGVWSVPGIGRWKFPEAQQTLDYIGVNFYTRFFMRWTPNPKDWPGHYCPPDHHAHEVAERTRMGWEVHPPSLYRLLLELKPLNVPLFVTENGAALDDDRRRWKFIENHLKAVWQAMQEGVPIMGYLYWSLMDNFEWADGYGPRFGIVEVDYKTQERRVRESGRRFADVCRTNRLETTNGELSALPKRVAA